MAGQKETPRQKMIGMMYLVLTALLAINVSREVLMGFVTVNESLERTNNSFNEASGSLMNYFSEYVKKDTGGIYYYERAKDAEKISQRLFSYVEDLKKKLISVTEERKKNEADTSRLRYLDALDNYDAPTFALFGDDETKPLKGEYSAYELRVKINEACSELQKIFEGDRIKTKFLAHDLQRMKKKIEMIRPVDPPQSVAEGNETWEMQNFYHLPLAAVITNLSKIQSDIRNVESETINTIAKSVMSAVPKIDQFFAAVTAPADYIQQGDKYESSIFLAAGSSTVKREIFIGDFDAATNTFKTEPIALPIGSDGRALYTAPGGSPGEKKYAGAIKMTKENGEIQWFPFNESYVVAPPSISVSSELMNVVYAGIENKLNIAAAGIAPKDLKVECENAQLDKLIDGQYKLTDATNNKVKMKVYSVKDGSSKLQGTCEFRVKYLPTPVIKMAGKGGANRSILKAECQNVKLLSAMPEDFILSIPYKVINWELTIKTGGGVNVIQGTSNSLSAPALQALNRVQAGNSIYIDAKVESPDKRTHIVSTKLTVQ